MCIEVDLDRQLLKLTEWFEEQIAKCEYLEPFGTWIHHHNPNNYCMWKEGNAKVTEPQAKAIGALS